MSNKLCYAREFSEFLLARFHHKTTLNFYRVYFIIILFDLTADCFKMSGFEVLQTRNNSKTIMFRLRPFTLHVTYTVYIFWWLRRFLDIHALFLKFQKRNVSHELCLKPNILNAYYQIKISRNLYIGGMFFILGYFYFFFDVLVNRDSS